MHFRKWSVRKLRRRPRSRDKFDNSADSKLLPVKETPRCCTSSDDSEISNSLEPKKGERASLSSEESANLELKNESTLYNKILPQMHNHVERKEATSGSESLMDEIDKTCQEIVELRKKGVAFNIQSGVYVKSNSDGELSSRSDNSLITSNEVDEDIAENKDLGTEKCKIVESDVLMFGCDLPKPMIDGNLELSSDQDSTAGEDEEFADEEDIQNLYPDMVIIPTH